MQYLGRLVGGGTKSWTADTLTTQGMEDALELGRTTAAAFSMRYSRANTLGCICCGVHTIGAESCMRTDYIKQALGEDLRLPLLRRELN